MISNGSMSASRSGTRRHVEVDPHPALGRHLRRRGGQARRRPRSCSATSSPRSSSSSEHSSSFFSSNGSPIWTRRALGGVLLAQLGRGEHGRAADAVAARARAEQHDDVADAGGRGADQPLRLDQPEAHRVDEAVLLVGGLEVDLAADGRHADRVAVVADAGHRALEQVARAGRRRRLAEAQRVEDGDRPRADREDVAQDAADAGGGALERLHRARVVVRLDLERAREPAADVHRARVLARAHDHARALGRQRPQQPARVLVAAVLGPHEREDGQLHLVGLALHELRRSARTRSR